MRSSSTRSTTSTSSTTRSPRSAACSAANGLEVVAVERIPIHGGSLRVTAALAGAAPVQPEPSTRCSTRSATRTRPDLATTATSAPASTPCATRSRASSTDLRKQGRTHRRLRRGSEGHGAAQCARASGTRRSTSWSTATRTSTTASCPARRIPIAPVERAARPTSPTTPCCSSWNFADEVLEPAGRVPGARRPVPRADPRAPLRVTAGGPMSGAVWGLLLAAGDGTRFGGRKQFAEAGRPHPGRPGGPADARGL